MPQAATHLMLTSGTSCAAPQRRFVKITPLTLVSPKILDGSIITVGKVPEEEPLDKTEFAKEVASILADLAQVVIMVMLMTTTGTGG